MGLLGMGLPGLGGGVRDGLDRDDPAPVPFRPGPEPHPDRRPVGPAPPGLAREVWNCEILDCEISDCEILPGPRALRWSRSARRRPLKAAGAIARSAARAGLAARMRRSGPLTQARPTGAPSKAKRGRSSSGRPGAASGLWSKAAHSW